jgi:hypothetical protein
MSGNRILRPNIFAGSSLSYPGGVVDFVPTGSPLTWYDASKLVGLSDNDPVASFTDQTSGNHHLVQAAADNKPLYIASGQNTLPVVRFDGLDDFLKVTVAMGATITMFIAMKQVSWTANDRFLACAGDTELVFYQPSSTPTIGINRGSTMSDNGFSVGTFGLITLLFKGASSVIRLNGSEIDSGDSGDGSTTSTIVLGSRASAASLFGNFDVGELVIYNSEESFTDNETGLMTKWGIT